MHRALVVGLVRRLAGALVATAGLLAGAAVLAAPVEAGDCARLTVESLTGPAQVDGGTSADYRVTVHNPADRDPGGDPCNDGMQLEIDISGSVQPSGAIDAGSGILCTEILPASILSKGGYRCVAVAFDGGDRVTLTVPVKAADAGRGTISVATWRLEETSSASAAGGFGRKSFDVTVRPRTVATTPTVRAGATGENVTTIQYLLRHHGADVEVDGEFMEQTEGAVRDFQRNTRPPLPATGVVDRATWAKLFVEVKQTSRGEAVRAVQSQLAARGVDVEVDGNFGPQTDAAVREFQGRVDGLAVDGVVGPQTWAALLAAD